MRKIHLKDSEVGATKRSDNKPPGNNDLQTESELN